MDLPNEIVLALLSLLACSDLKSARLVSKHWSLCAAEFLFHTIYISPSKVDIDVFQAITQHPDLSRCPRHLEYIGSEFLTDYPRDQYAKAFWAQTLRQLYLYSRASGEEWLDPDAEISAWMNGIKSFRRYSDSESEYSNRYQDSKIVNDGYRKYRKHAKYQESVLYGIQNSQYLEILVRGLQHLSSLASVAVQPNWLSTNIYHNCLLDNRSGSPLARSWHAFFPGPRDWIVKDDKDQPRGPDGARHYLIISSALAQAQKRLRKFRFGHSQPLPPGLPPYVWNSSDNLNAGNEIAAFSGLEEFGITLASFLDTHHDKTTTVARNMHHLQLLLASMDQLITLNLTLPSLWNGSWWFVRRDHVRPLYAQEQVFSAASVWSKLTEFKLISMSTTAQDLLLLLVFQMPKLRHLELGDIYLSEGTWHTVIEGLKQSNRFSSFRISPSMSLRHRGGITFMSHVSRFLKPVENYITRGGHHPCIPPNEPSDAAQVYMNTIEISLRDRLAELDSTRSEELDSVARKAWMDATPEWSESTGPSDRLDGSQAYREMLVGRETEPHGYQYSNFTL